MAITKKQLIEMLAEYPDESIIIVQKDAEGNDYSPLAEICEGHYEPDSTDSGEIYPCAKGRGDAIVLIPIN